MTDNKLSAERLAQECGSRVLHDKVHDEARKRHLSDATQSGYDHHSVRVAAEHGARFAILAMAEENARWSEAVTAIMARCEALEDESHDMIAKADCSKTTSFYSGQKFTAKSLRRELHDLTRALADQEGRS